MHKQKLFPDQLVPMISTALVCLSFIALLWIEVKVLNFSAISREHIETHVLVADVIIGMTIYLKTSIDFAIFIGRLMSKYPGWKNRIMIEVGTSAGNALGTFLILLIWDLFREVRPLMAVMIVLAALVLIRMAEEGLEHAKRNEKYPLNFFKWINGFEKSLHLFNKAVSPVLSKLIPDLSISNAKRNGFKALFFLSFTVPFILGLDDFAGYIPLFNIVHVFGFAIGVLVGHMILLIFLFLSPRRTTAAVQNPIISLIGSVAFVGLAVWGLFEAFKLVL